MDAIIGFIAGIGLAVVFIVDRYDLIKKKNSVVPLGIDEEMDDKNYFYVLLPDSDTPVEICVEEPLDLNHRVNIRGDEWYVVTSINHNVNGHTVYNLKAD